MPGPELETHMAEQNYGKRMTSVWNTLSRRLVWMVNGTCFLFSPSKMGVWINCFIELKLGLLASLAAKPIC